MLHLGEKSSAGSTRSVFEKDKWVDCLLSSEDLMDAYDLELTVQASLKGHCKSEGKSQSRSFVKAVPTKVLRLVASVLIDRTMKGNKGRFVVPIRAVPGKNQNGALSSLPNSSQEIGNESVGKEVCPRVKEPLDVAARPDDAEAEAEHWDKWLVISFVCPYGKVPLVCREGYDVERHGPLFEGMRKLSIRRYRKNVMRSYLSFMRNNMGMIRSNAPLLSLASGKIGNVALLSG